MVSDGVIYDIGANDGGSSRLRRLNFAEAREHRPAAHWG